MYDLFIISPTGVRIKIKFTQSLHKNFSNSHSVFSFNWLDAKSHCLSPLIGLGRNTIEHYVAPYLNKDVIKNEMYKL